MQKPESDGLDLALSSWEYKMSGYQRGKTFSSWYINGLAHETFHYVLTGTHWKEIMY